MDDRQRDELLDRIHRSSATVGGSIPETVLLEGESIPLREFYFEISDKQEIQTDEEERFEEILTYLRRERLRLIQLIENDEVDYESANELVPKISDLDRAIDAFESLEGPDLDEQLRQEKIKSAEGLVDLMRGFGKL